jgi:hypothetical protein
VLSAVTLLFSFQLNAQEWWKKRKPHVSIWDYPRSVELNLLNREYSRSIHFGFGMGLNAFDFSGIKNSGNTVFIPGQGNVVLFADLIQVKPGFSINAISDCRLVTNLNLRFLPGIFFGNRMLNFYRSDTKGLIQSMPISSNYLEFPVILKYSANRYTNFRPYVITGLNTRINLSNDINIDAQRYIKLSKLEPFAEIGLGFDFYLSYFRLSTEIKISMGLINCLSPEEVAGYEFYKRSLKSLHSNTVGFTFNFEL